MLPHHFTFYVSTTFEFELIILIFIIYTIIPFIPLIRYGKNILDLIYGAHLKIWRDL